MYASSSSVAADLMADYVTGRLDDREAATIRRRIGDDRTLANAAMAARQLNDRVGQYLAAPRRPSQRQAVGQPSRARAALGAAMRIIAVVVASQFLVATVIAITAILVPLAVG